MGDRRGNEQTHIWFSGSAFVVYGKGLIQFKCFWIDMLIYLTIWRRHLFNVYLCLLWCLSAFFHYCLNCWVKTSSTFRTCLSEISAFSQFQNSNAIELHSFERETQYCQHLWLFEIGEYRVLCTIAKTTVSILTQFFLHKTKIQHFKSSMWLKSF